MSFSLDLVNSYLLSQSKLILPKWFARYEWNGSVFEEAAWWIDTATGKWGERNGDGSLTPPTGSGLVELYALLNFKDVKWALAALSTIYKFDIEEWTPPAVDKSVACVEAELLPAQSLEERYPTMASGFMIPQSVKNKEGVERIKMVPDFIGFADYMQTEIGFCSSQGFAYQWDKNHYSQVNELDLKNKIDLLTLEANRPSVINDFAVTLNYKAAKPASYFVQPQGLLNLANGVVDLKSRELLPHTKDRFFKYVIPHDYDPTATCPRWLEYLDFVFEENKELANLSAEIFGYILYGGDPWLHRAFVLEGSGRNGKSTWLAVLKAVVGSENYSAIPMKHLEKPFSVVMADGKLANIVGELEGRDLSSEVFKIAVGGEELIASKKGRDEYKLAFQARLVFATNSMPHFGDASEGLTSKFCILPFKRFITEEQRDGDIIPKLTAELPGILNWALDGLERLIKRTKLPYVQAVQDEVDEYKEKIDSVYRFFKRAVKSESEVQLAVKVTNLYPGYAAWCKEESCVATNRFNFGKRFRKIIEHHYPHVEITKPNGFVCVKGKFTIKTFAYVGGQLTTKEVPVN